MTKIDRKDVLIGRVIGREDRPQDWRELRSLAEQDQELWQMLVADMEGESMLRAASAQCLQAAQRVELPLPMRRSAWIHSLGAFINPLGWVAALVMGLLWIATPGHLTEAPVAEIMPTISIASEGDFVTELPRVLVSSGPNAAGDAFELLYMRRILERVQIDEVLRMRHDEAGHPFATAVSLADYRPAQSY